MSRDSTFEGSLSASSELTESQVAAFAEVVDSNELRLSFFVDENTGTLSVSSDTVIWTGYHPRGFHWSEHRERRFELGMNMEFDEFLAHLISQPEFEGLEFTGQFDVVTDDDPFPRIRRVTVADGQVRVSAAVITFGEGEVTTAPAAASL
ncbi:MAG: hypothetical protein H9W81_09885 [Enterococcus sp.]|nr:hypothetical protein [Enterococcus sp.]